MAEDARLGIVSDTHGLLRSELFSLFDGVDRILHAGDVGEPRILVELEAVAPVEAVWGNVDGGQVRRRTAEVREGEVAGLAYVVVHGHQVSSYRDLPGRFPDARMVVHGHSHEPTARWIDDVLVLNPGSAGPRRFEDPVTAALVRVRGGEPEVEHHDLLTGGAWSPAEG